MNPVTPAKRAGPAHSETVIAKFPVWHSFKVPPGITLQDATYWVKYDQLHYIDADGVERVVDSDGIEDEDFKRPEEEELVCDTEQSMEDYQGERLCATAEVLASKGVPPEVFATHCGGLDMDGMDLNAL